METSLKVEQVDCDEDHVVETAAHASDVSRLECALSPAVCLVTNDSRPVSPYTPRQGSPATYLSGNDYSPQSSRVSSPVCRRAGEENHRCTVKCHRSTRETAAVRERRRQEARLSERMERATGNDPIGGKSKCDGEPCETIGATSHDSEDDEGWSQVPTRQEKAVKTAAKKVAKETASTVTQNVRKAASTETQLELLFHCPDNPEALRSLSVFKIAVELSKSVPGANARITTQGKLAIRLKDPSQMLTAKGLNKVCGVSIQQCPDISAFWGRIYGVNPQFTDDDILECLKDQGVDAVKREVYAVATRNDNGNATKTWKNSSRVRLRFDTMPVSEVHMAGENYKVTLCAGSPLQCLRCHKYGHKASECQKRNDPSCRKCGCAGHEMWECQNKARCVNCGGAHASNNNSCGVRKVYREAERVKLYAKVSARLPVSGDFPSLIKEPHNVSSEPVEKQASYADVVRPATQKLKQVLHKDGETVLCNLPPPAAPKKQAAETKKQTSQRMPAKSQSEKKKSSTNNSSHIVTAILRIWKKMKPMLSTWLDENPIIKGVLSYLESEIGIAFMKAVVDGTEDPELLALPGAADHST